MHKPHVTPEEQIQTVDLYLRYANSNRVGEALNISGSAVRDRLYALDVPLRPWGVSTVTLEWQEAVLARLAWLRGVYER
jgi:hypothetical protein